MGWSCTIRAAYSLEELVRLLRGSDGGAPKASNSFYDSRGRCLFYERSSREHLDGAITGSVWQMLDGAEGGRCRRVGSFRVEGDGRIVRFPGAAAGLRSTAEVLARARYEREHAGAITC